MAATNAAVAEREKALDPLASPDITKARAAMEDAAFTRDRLRTVLPRLQQKFTEVEAAEYAARWDPDFKQVEAERDELAAEFREKYPRLVKELVDLLGRMEAVDKEASRVAGSAPPGEPRRLRGAEQTARGVDFSRDVHSIAKELVLPAFEPGKRPVWPPREPSLAEAYAATVVQNDSRLYSGDWWMATAERNIRGQANEKRWGEEEQARQAESKRRYEESLPR